ncbi:ATP-dependent Clp protease adapter ClpS [Lacisediminihabitans sp.]|jgi:ATP-dependent Clp protease adaptor protein ClpS|uniref:ATP-dependent Clp protease adapter ClpS n=1 Tax=Lacisediminihabitans sp. TaxID=2787631 RepID=UPI002F94F84E
MTEVLERPDLVDLPEIVESTALDTPWVTIVWNDPVNLMSYVSYVFRSYFGFSKAEAERRMLQVHNDGRAVVATGSREEMERHVEAMHDFGLWATLAKADDA